MPLNMMSYRLQFQSCFFLVIVASAAIWAQTVPADTTVLHAARLVDIESGRISSPGEVLVRGDRIVEVGTTVKHPAGAAIIDLGNRTLLPGLIDAHIHLFLHPGAEDLQTVQESVPQRTIVATIAARDDLMAGFTAERDMGTEGAGSADTAVRDAIDRGEIPGPRLRISGNAINILGGHEDAIGYNPAQHVLPNADFANDALQLIEVMREQFKEGSDFAKIYETGADSLRDGVLSSPYQYSVAELSAAVHEAGRMGKRVAVHATDDPGALYAAQAGVASIDHSFQIHHSGVLCGASADAGRRP
jgi:imidazolonepropionase-like amidohydrolase